MQELVLKKLEVQCFYALEGFLQEIIFSKVHLELNFIKKLLYYSLTLDKQVIAIEQQVKV